MEIMWITWVIILIFIYFLPSLIAIDRKSSIVWIITLLNLFLWWTIIFRIILLVLAITSKTVDDIKLRELQLEQLKQSKNKVK